VAWDEAYLRTKWHLDPSWCLAAIDMDHGFVRKPRKRGRVAVPLSMGEIGLHLTMWHGLRPTSVPLPSGILIHPAVWLQETWAKIGGCALLGRGAGFPANTMRPRLVEMFSCNWYWDKQTRLGDRLGRGLYIIVPPCEVSS